MGCGDKSCGSGGCDKPSCGSKKELPQEDKPSDAPESCPGTQSADAGKASGCGGCPNQTACSSGGPKQVDPDLAHIISRMSSVRHKVLVLSGKGGVGKSTFSSQIAFALAAQGKDVGLMDVDVCGPSIPRMLGLEGEEIHQSQMGWSPVYVDENLGVMSIGFMLPNPDEAVIWRGPRKNGLIKQFLKDVYWGTLDFLVVDTPPGTSDEHISTVQFLKSSGADGAIIVTTPQEVSLADVRKEINFCKRTGIKVLGVVENMSGLQQKMSDLKFKDSNNNDITDTVLSQLDAVPALKDAFACAELFHAEPGAVEAMCKKFDVPFLGRVPMDPKLGAACEKGESILAQTGESPSMPALKSVVDQLIKITTPELEE